MGELRFAGQDDASLSHYVAIRAARKPQARRGAGAAMKKAANCGPFRGDPPCGECVRSQRWRALKRGLLLQITKTLPRRRTTLQSRCRDLADFSEDSTFMTKPSGTSNKDRQL